MFYHLDNRTQLKLCLTRKRKQSHRHADPRRQWLQVAQRRNAIPAMGTNNYAVSRPVQFTVHQGVPFVGHMFPPKIDPPLRVSSLPPNTWFLGPSPLINQNGISIGSAVFVWVPNDMLYNALSTGKKTPKIVPSLGISLTCQTRTEPWL